MVVKIVEDREKDRLESACRPLAELLESVRNIEGFPKGEDEEILALSKPPYYTACPNPYIKDYILQYGSPYDALSDTYQHTPFVGDVSEGKNDPIYTLHSYHTKVPHKAIMQYINHYTREGDIVFDGFCGSGMTAVAAQILKRKCILSDISPIASFIAYNYNTPIDAKLFKEEAHRILKEVEEENKWMYETIHSDGETKGRINYTVWSEMFICPYCDSEFVFGEVAVNQDSGRVYDKFPCPQCSAEITKRICKRAEFNFYDNALKQEVTQTKQKPVLINYSVGKERFVKVPDEYDLALIKKIDENDIPYWYPIDAMMHKGREWGDTWRAGIHYGVNNIHHFYTKRNLWILAAVWDRAKKSEISSAMLFLVEQLIWGMSKLSRYVPTHYSQANQYLSGTLYIGSQVVEVTPEYILKTKINKLSKAYEKMTSSRDLFVSVNSCTNTTVPSNSIDYIFTDPPFGDNLMYSELNFLWEAWHRLFTNIKTEAIMNSSNGKGLIEYKELMIACFREMYRILKPNRWMTVEFHNSRASVWNAIQDSVTKAGFIIAQVTILDKQQGSFKQVTSAGTVKNDLVISAYKPKLEFEERFLSCAGEGLERDFVEEHLTHLPIEMNIERTEQMLYSKMLAYYIQHGYEINMDARAFYGTLAQFFYERDGYWFTEKQVDGYEEAKKLNKFKTKDIADGAVFISDEKSAIAWLNLFLTETRSYSDIFIAVAKALVVSEDQIPELKQILDENFVSEGGKYRRPEVLEKHEIEERRNKRLLKEFEDLLVQAKAGKKMKDVRKEAILVGLTQCYRDKRFEDIITLAKKLPPKIVETSTEIYDYIDIAEAKLSKY